MEKSNKGYRVDISGKTFGNLIVLSFAYKKDTHSYWNCKCLICGNTCIRPITYLKTNKNPMCQNCAIQIGQDKNIKPNKIEYEDEFAIINNKIIVDKDDLEKILSYNRYISINSEGYAYFTWRGIKEIFLHRFLMGLPKSYDSKTKIIVDHINGNRLDNRKSNLRICSKSKNSINCKTYKNNTSGCKGVDWKKSINKWQASIHYNKEKHYLGVYADYNEAVRVRKEAEEKYFKEFKRNEENL